MNNKRARKAVSSIALIVGLLIGLSPAAWSQGTATITKDPKTGNIQLKALTSKDLKDAISHAMEAGDIETKDGKALIEKITDIETLMDQFDFIRDQQRRLIGSYGSVIH